MLALDGLLAKGKHLVQPNPPADRLPIGTRLSKGDFARLKEKGGQWSLEGMVYTKTSDEAQPLANAGDDALPSIDEIEQFKTKHGIK